MFDMSGFYHPLFAVLEYVSGKWVCEGSCPSGSIGESKSRRYLRDVVAGLMYLHAHVRLLSFILQF